MPVSPTLMTYRELAEILSAVAWPATVGAIAYAFHKPLFALLQKLQESLSIKVVKLKLFGAEIELTPNEADRALNEILQEVGESTNELSPVDIELLKRIYEAQGTLTIEQVFPGFTRRSQDDPERKSSGELEQLRKLRDMKLLRPSEGGKWNVAKHPVVTRFGEIFLKLEKQGRLGQRAP
jgi:hypothetical protein